MTWEEHPRLQDMAAPGARRAAPRVSNNEKTGQNSARIRMSTRQRICEGGGYIKRK